jgi:hypothetical protein
MHERTNIQLSATDRSALETVVANRNSPQKARLASKDHPYDGRRSWHCRNHAGNRQGQDGDLALAGTVSPGGRGRTLARQDASLAHFTVEP